MVEHDGERPGAALLVERRDGSWLEVRRDDGVHGWVLSTEVSRP